MIKILISVILFFVPSVVHAALVPVSLQRNTTGGFLQTLIGSDGLIVNASSSISDLSVVRGTTTNATSTNLYISGQTKVGSLSGLLKGTSGILSAASNGTDYTLISETTCSGTDKVSAISASGIVTCSTDETGAGGTWATTSTQYFVHSSTTIPKTYTSNIWTNNNTFNAQTFIANDTALEFGGGSGSVSQLKTGSDGTLLYDVGVNFKIKILSSQYVAFYRHDFNTEIFKVDSSGNILNTGTRTVSGTSNATIPNLTITNGTSTSATTTNLAVTSLTSELLKVNGNGLVQEAVADTDYQVPLTFGDGLTRTLNDIDVDTVQNIVKLSNLTSNGFIKTSGGDGTLSVDTSTYLTGNQTVTLSGVVSGSGATSIPTAYSGVDPRGWNVVNGALTPTTTTYGILVNNATSTFTNLTVANGTTTNATSTNLKVSGQLNIGSLSGVLKGTSGVVSVGADGTDFSLITALTCTGTDKLSAVTADGTFTCSADQTGGAGSGTDKFATSTDNASIYVNSAVKTGFGSSSPWGIVSIASSSPTYSSPLFVVSTSTDSFGRLFSIESTSTSMLTARGASDTGTRVLIGTTTNANQNTGLLDQLTLNGRINTSDWRLYECSAVYGSVNGDSTSAVCGSFAFQVDAGGFLGSSVDITSGIIGSVLCDTTSVCSGAVAAGNGVGIFLSGGNNTTPIQFSTSTPVMESIMRINNPVTASSSRFVMGYTNISASGSAFEVEPTVGCYFVASTSAAGAATGLANWQAECRTSMANTTTVDTGFASTTKLTGVGAYQKFRIEIDNQGAKFYMASSSAPLRMVAYIRSNVPTTTPLNAGIYHANLLAGLAKGIDLALLRLWVYQPALQF